MTSVGEARLDNSLLCGFWVTSRSPAGPLDRDCKYASANGSKAAPLRPVGERDDDWQGLEGKNSAWSEGMTVALSKENLEKLWASSEVRSSGASKLCYSSLVGQLQNHVPCLGLFLTLDI